MKKKIVWIIVAAILVLGAVGGGIYFYYFKQASADVIPIGKLADEVIRAQKAKYPDGSCLPRYSFKDWTQYAFKNGKTYVKITIDRLKADKCEIRDSKCWAVFSGIEKEYFFYVSNKKGGYNPVSKVPDGLDWKGNPPTFGPWDSIELPFACCQVNPTPTPTPSSSTSPTPTRTTTPSPSSTSSTGPTPSGR